MAYLWKKLTLCKWGILISSIWCYDLWLSASIIIAFLEVTFIWAVLNDKTLLHERSGYILMNDDNGGVFMLRASKQFSSVTWMLPPPIEFLLHDGLCSFLTVIFISVWVRHYCFLDGQTIWCHACGRFLNYLFWIICVHSKNFKIGSFWWFCKELVNSASVGVSSKIERFYHYSSSAVWLLDGVYWSNDIKDRLRKRSDCLLKRFLLYYIRLDASAQFHDKISPNPHKASKIKYCNKRG